MLGCVDEEVNVHIVQNLSAIYNVDKKCILARPGLTRAGIEETVQNAYISEKKDVEKGKGQTKAVDPHALYAGGVQPAGAGDGWTGKDYRGKQRNGKQRDKQQKQPQQQHKQQPYHNGGSAVVGPLYPLDLVCGQWR